MARATASSHTRGLFAYATNENSGGHTSRTPLVESKKRVTRSQSKVFNILKTAIISNPYGAANGYSFGNDPSLVNGNSSPFGCGCATPDIAAGNAMVGSGSSRVMQLGLKLSF